MGHVKKRAGGIYATGHDWRWDPKDPTRSRATCPCGVVTDVDRPDPANIRPRFYIVNGERVDALPPCTMAEENDAAWAARHASMIRGHDRGQQGGKSDE
jgi:hypothetical protein